MLVDQLVYAGWGGKQASYQQKTSDGFIHLLFLSLLSAEFTLPQCFAHFLHEYHEWNNIQYIAYYMQGTQTHHYNSLSYCGRQVCVTPNYNSTIQPFISSKLIILASFCRENWEVKHWIFGGVTTLHIQMNDNC